MRHTAIVVAAVTILTGCMTTGQSMLGRQLYTTTEREMEMLEGNVTVKELLLHKDSSISRTEFISLAVYDTEADNEDFASFILRLDSSSWRFPETLGVSIDNRTQRFTPDNEDTEVISGTWVSETYWFSLDQATMDALANADTLRFQIPGSDIITVSSAGVAKARDLINSL